jgi:hypothetical protein
MSSETQTGTSEASPDSTPEGTFSRVFTRLVTFRRMEVVSLLHSVVYLALLISAFLLGGPQPWTFIFGLTHGIVWILMSITSVLAVHYRVINLRLAVAIGILGCIAPFFGSFEFLRQSRQSRLAVTAGSGGS